MSHPYLGDVSFYAHQMPNIQALELSIPVPDKSLVISDTHPCHEAINISFQLTGGMVTSFAGIHHPMNMKTGVHNLVCLSGDNHGDRHAMEGRQNLSVFQITIDKTYYAGCLDCNNKWSENVVNSIEKNKTFSAAEQSLTITPRMLQLIQFLQHDKSDKPMKILLFQSRMFELLALQIEQFTDHDKKGKTVSAAGSCAKII